MKKEQLEILISALERYIFYSSKEKRKIAKKLLKIFLQELKAVDNSGY